MSKRFLEVLYICVLNEAPSFIWEGIHVLVLGELPQLSENTMVNGSHVARFLNQTP